MANKRIDELTSVVPGNVDVVPTSYATTGPAYKSTVASVVAAGLNQPNSATSGAGANITIKAADGVTSGAGGNIILQAGAQATSGGDGVIQIKSAAGVNSGKLQGSTGDLKIIPESGKNVIIYDGYNGGGTNVVFQTTQSGSEPRISMPFGVLVNSFYFINGQVYGNSYASLTSWNLNLGFRGATVQAGMTGGSVGVLRVTEGNFSDGGSLAYTHSDIDLTGITNAAAFTGSGYQRITGGTVLNGILPPSGGAHISGRMIKIVNTTGSAITVNDDSASCTVVGNRLKIPSGSSINFGANHMLQCIYDTVDSRWRVWMTS